MGQRGGVVAIVLGLVVYLGLPSVLGGVVVMSLVGGAGLCGTGQAGSPGGSQRVGERTFTTEQLTNAHTIISVVQQRTLPKRAAVLAVSTAIVESDLRNVHHGDRDSQGLFQQRPSQGWGSVEQVTNPVYATNSFLDRLMTIPSWWTLPPGVAQQMVQRSAFPDRYAPAEKPAAELVAQFWQGPDNPPPSAGGGGTAQAAGYGGNQRCPERGGASLSSTTLDKLPPDYRLPADPRQRKAVSFALAQLGKPYVWGAKGPEAFDCSGLMMAAWSHAGVPISASTTGQVDDGRAVSGLHALQPGDLVFIPGSMGTAANPRHVGIYAGHGLIVNAYDQSTGVILQKLSDWAPEVVAIRRIAEPTNPAPPPQLGNR